MSTAKPLPSVPPTPTAEAPAVYVAVHGPALANVTTNDFRIVIGDDPLSAVVYSEEQATEFLSRLSVAVQELQTRAQTVAKANALRHAADAALEKARELQRANERERAELLGTALSVEAPH